MHINTFTNETRQKLFRFNNIDRNQKKAVKKRQEKPQKV